MEDKIKKIMATVFAITEESIGAETSPNTVESWDSLRQMNLVVALEEELDVELTDDEIIAMTDYSTIISVISSKF